MNAEIQILLPMHQPHTCSKKQRKAPHTCMHIDLVDYIFLIPEGLETRLLLKLEIAGCEYSHTTGPKAIFFDREVITSDRQLPERAQRRGDWISRIEIPHMCTQRPEGQTRIKGEVRPELQKSKRITVETDCNISPGHSKLLENDHLRCGSLIMILALAVAPPKLHPTPPLVTL